MQTIIFAHIPKTAGTALMNALRRSLRKKFVHHAGPRHEAEALMKMPIHERAMFKAFGAHLPATTLRQMFGPDAYYFTVVREPVSRIVSLAAHLARRPEHREHEFASKGLNAWLDYLERTPEHLWLAHQAYFVQPYAGRPWPEYLDIFDGRDLDAVVNRVARVAGGAPAPAWRLNASENRQSPTQLQTERIKTLFAADFRLYDSVRTTSK